MNILKSLGLKTSLKCLRMPMLSPTMTSARIVKWHCATGSHLRDYDLVATIDVDNLTNTSENISSMLLEIQEEMIVGKVFDASHISVGSPLLLMCQNIDDYNIVSYFYFA